MNKEALLVLAGGKSSRMGSPKGLILNPKSNLIWLTDQCLSARKAQLTQGRIVVGFDSNQYTNAYGHQCEGFGLTLNPNPEQGSFSSLIIGLRSLLVNSEVYWIWVLPIDVPFLDEDSASKMRGYFHNVKENVKVIRPRFGSKTGHPIVISRRFAEDLCHLATLNEIHSLRLDEQIRELACDEVIDVSIDNSTVLLNINTPTDFSHFLTQS